MRRAHRDRAEYLGDPDFVDVPIAKLVHPYYAAGQRAAIRMDRATPSDALPGITVAEPGQQTTHFSGIDAEAKRVAGTLSINFFFGSGLMVPGVGVMLNNGMDDFAAKPGVPNGFRLVGADANAIAPGKRPLSSMTPTFVEKSDGLMILGTRGGSYTWSCSQHSTGWTGARRMSSFARVAITTSTCRTYSHSDPAR
jgi:gamma-glutamyltranspeptidase / glutathione hydrolase